MKTLVTLTLLTLICFMRHSSAGPLAAWIVSRGGCCLNHTQLHIPKDRVKHVEMSGCSFKAIVVTSVCNKKFCVDPKWTWAKKLLTEFQNATANNQPPSAPFNLVKCENMAKKP